MAIRGSLLTMGLVALSAPVLAGSPEGTEEAKLAYKAYQDWSFVLPNETWHRADEHCGIEHAGDPDGFATEQSGVLALEVDTNGDGKLDERIKGNGGFAKLRGETADGERFTYAVRFVYNRGYRWSASGAMVGKLKGQTFKLIDQNGNGRYDDFGVDAMVIGATDAASYLSSVVNVAGELYDLEVSADGADVTIAPYEGETGTLSLSEGFESRGKLVAAIVSTVRTSSKAPSLSYDLAAAPNGLKVPAGKYVLRSGFAQKAGETVWIRSGKSLPMEVRAGKSFELEWGGPVVAEIDYDVDGEEITVSANVAFYGKAGEEYHSFKPDAKSPKILVKDRDTGELLDSGRFGGC